MTTPTVETLPCNGVDLSYLDWGVDSSDPAILIHGIHGHSRSWDTVADSIQDIARPIAFDMRGHGDSDQSTDGIYTPELLVQDAITFAVTLGLTGFSLVGHSLGGLVAMGVAANVGDMISKLIIVDIGPHFGEEGMREIHESSVDRPQSFESLDEAVAWSFERSPLGQPEEVRRSMEFSLRTDDDGLLRWKYDPRVDQMLAGTDGGGEEMLWSIWQAVSCPTLIIRGAESKLLTAETATEMVSRNPNASLIEISNAGHDVPADNPRALTKAIRDFLGGSD